MSIQTPFVTPFVSIRDFGAVPNDPSSTARLANTESFKQAQAAMQSLGQAWGHPLFVPSGTYYLSEDLHISKQLELFGTGMQGESVLMFPAGKSLIIDSVSDIHPELTGSDSMIRDLQIISEGNWTYGPEDSLFDPSSFDPRILEGTSKGTPGIRMQASAIIQRVYIARFSGTGIYIFGGIDANYWRIHDVYINTCGGHGIHVDGKDTQGGLCTGAKILAIGGTGIVNSSEGGNTYVGCYVFTAKGRGYTSDSGSQNTFVGCFSEANERVRLSVGGNVWIGGTSGKGFTDDTVAFIAEGYGNIYPFEVPNSASFMKAADQVREFGANFKQLTLKVGFPNDLSDPTTLYAWKNNDHGYLVRWDEEHQAWTIENAFVPPVPAEPPDTIDRKPFHLRELTARGIAAYLTGPDHPRGPWLQGFTELLLGSVNGPPIKISRGFLPDDGKRGDIVYNVEPIVGEYIGHVCIGLSEAGTAEWRPFGKIEA